MEELIPFFPITDRMVLQRVDLLLRDNVPNMIENGEILVSLDYTHNHKGLMPLE